MEHVDIFTLFPLIREIEDDVLRIKTEQVICDAMEQGGWTIDTVRACPFSLKYGTAFFSLIDHINSVAGCCLASFPVCKALAEKNGVRFDRDIILSGALLHDIGKFTEYCLSEEGKPQISDSGKLMRHTLSGALLAAKRNLPNDVCQMIATHGFEGDHVPHTAESLYLRSMDIMAFNIVAYPNYLK